MKRTIAMIIFCGALYSTGLATVLMFLVTPQDDPDVRRSLIFSPGLKQLQDGYGELITLRLLPLKLDDVAKVFGPKLLPPSSQYQRKAKELPADLVLPIFGHGNDSDGSATMDLGNMAIEPNSHRDLHAIGDIGYVDFYYQRDGVSLYAAVIYFRADDKFVPLTSTNDFVKRLDWDKARYQSVKTWLDAHLPKMTDLGVVEVSESEPIHLDFTGPGYVLRIQVTHFAGLTNFWYTLYLQKETTNVTERFNTMQVKPISHTNQRASFGVDGKFFILTPKFVGPITGQNN